MQRNGVLVLFCLLFLMMLFFVFRKRGIPSINYFVNYYRDGSPARQQEIDKCLENNAMNPLLDRIYVIGTPEDLAQIPKLNQVEKVSWIPFSSRPTFADFFRLINQRTGKEDINILSNSDIYFDDTLRFVPRYLTRNACLALTRWDILSDGNAKFFDVEFSQDAWVFQGQIKNDRAVGQYPLGKLGCDNRIAKELMDNGYTVKNPSRTIKTYHLHLTNVRNYTATERIPGEGTHVKPSY